MTYEVYLAHHGVKGQKWGVRRYQNEDGTYTAAGKSRYLKKAERMVEKYESQREKSRITTAKLNRRLSEHKSSDSLYRKAKRESAKSQKVLNKTAEYFKKELPGLSNKKLSDSELDRFSKLADRMLGRQDLVKRFNEGDESAFWQMYAEQEEYNAWLPSDNKKKRK